MPNVAISMAITISFFIISVCSFKDWFVRGFDLYHRSQRETIVARTNSYQDPTDRIMSPNRLADRLSIVDDSPATPMEDKYENENQTGNRPADDAGARRHGAL
jgi:hypothetical protein